MRLIAMLSIVAAPWFALSFAGTGLADSPGRADSAAIHVPPIPVDAGSVAPAAGDVAVADRVQDETPDEAATRVDDWIKRASVGPVAEVCEDQDFVRRVYLDLWGVIPTVEETRHFLSDKASEKRAALIDRLLAAPQFARHMAYTFDTWLAERRPDKGISRADWQEYLYQSFASGKPYDQLVREMLAADGAAGDNRVRAKFLLDRDCDPNGLVRDVGRMFLGRDWQCAQCHDHPLVDDYFQDEYHGLLALLQRSYLFTDKQNGDALRIGEKADGLPEFRSVFLPDKPQRMAIAYVPGRPPPDLPLAEVGGEYVVPPGDNARGVPRFSLRSELATQATVENPWFDRAIANRLWSHLFGVGIVDPVDMHHGDNPPSHPELLDYLADLMRRYGYDVARFLGTLARTHAYQRAIDPPPLTKITAARAEAMAQLPRSAAALEQLDRQRSAAEESLRQAREQRSAAERSVDGLLRTVTELRAKSAQANAAYAKVKSETEAAEKSLAEEKTRLEAVREASVKTVVALEKIPDDPQVKAASEALNSKLQGLEQGVKDLQTKLAAGSKQVAEVEATRQKLAGELAQGQQGLAEAYQPLKLAHRHWLAAQRTLDDVKARRSAEARRHRLAEGIVKIAELTVADASAAGNSGQQSSAPAPASALASAAAPDADAASASVSVSASAPGAPPATGGTSTMNTTERDRLYDELIGSWSRLFVVASPRPLTPEQLAWSCWQATGQLTLELQAVEAEWRKNNPAPANLDPTSQAERQARLTSDSRKALQGRMAGVVDQFARLFGGAAGQVQTDFHATADQALFLSNGGPMMNIVSAREQNLSARINKCENVEALADELYMSIVSRPATPNERAAVRDYLGQRAGERDAALRELVWSLLTSAEFRFYR